MRTGRSRSAFHAADGLVCVLCAVLMAWVVNWGCFQVQAGQAKPDVAETTRSEPVREWLEIFMGVEKVGYVARRVVPVGRGVLINEEILLKLSLMDVPVSTFTRTQCLMDEQFQLKRFHVAIDSGGARFKVSGETEEGWIRVEKGEGDARRYHRIKMAGPAVIPAAIPEFFKGRRLRKGQSFAFSMLDPATLTQRAVAIHVRGRELVEINEARVSAFRLESEVMGHRITSWLDDSGSVLREEGFMGLTLVRSSEGQALGGTAMGGMVDLYDLAAVTVDKPLKDPSNVGYLKLRVKGLTGTPFDRGRLQGDRQKFRDDIIEIRKEPLPRSAGFVIPFKRPGEMRDQLSPELNIESDDEAVVKTASNIAEGQTDPIEVSRKLVTWVHDHIEKRPVVSVPSAVEVLRTRTGDCNEHATLLTALLRAVGIPSRVSVGLVSFREKFYYHAWTEAFLGRWVSMDATLNQMPTDATHVRLATGGLDRQMDIIGLIGKLRLEVMDVAYLK
jgi:hypothetical protein